VLHLDPAVDLAPLDTGEAPIRLFDTNSPLALLVAQALQSRPELKQSYALVSASRATKDAALYGPLVPTLGAQVFGGGLGGGPDGGPSTFGAEGDYTVGLTWKIGPGGLFDSGRIGASKARLQAAELTGAKLKDSVVAQVVASLARMQSLADQIPLVQQNLATAAETLRLTRERKQFGVGIVLEDIQAEQALTEARADYFSAIAEFNKAQYSLNRAVGGQN
jgi:outer membrane protein TolC